MSQLPLWPNISMLPIMRLTQNLPEADASKARQTQDNAEPVPVTAITAPWTACL